MNFLAEVLSSAEEIECDKINTAVPEIVLAVENCKGKVNSFIENVYVTFSDNPKHHRMLLNDATRLYNETNSLQKRLTEMATRELPNKSKDVEKLALALKKASMTLDIVLNVRKINEGLIRTREYVDAKMYRKAIMECESIEHAISSCVPEFSHVTLRKDEQLIALEELRTQCITQKNMLLNTFSNLIRDNVVLHVNKGDQVNTMKIMKYSEEISEVFQALYAHTSHVFLLDEVTTFLWRHVFVPIVDYKTDVKVTEDEGFICLEIIVLDSSKHSPYTNVFSNLKMIVTYLNENFYHKLDDNFSSLDYIGRDVRDNLSQLIIKNCLQNTIPSTNEGLEKYKTVIEDTEQLEKVLVECHIFGEDTESILAYANNIDILFINKRCQEYLKAAESIMTKDLHNMKEVGAPYDLLTTVSEFSKCCVSKSVIELQHFLENILEEAVSSSEVCAGRLFCTVQKILELYTIFVPEYHEKLLQTIPQQIALYHNNCLYLAEKLVEWSEKYSKNLSSKLNIEPELFRDNSYILKTVGSEMFSTYVESQVKQIEDILQDVGLHNVQTLDKLEPNTEKCIRQCLRQQELLKTVWGKVLPYSIYNKTLGLILDSLCNSLINAVIKLEDIPSSVAEQLVDVLKVVVTRGPKLFTDSKEVTLFVPSWYKFNELVFVLNSSLLDINDRWADGKGPLALQFKPEELKKLIRALFQNTERRAAVLAKIM